MLNRGCRAYTLGLQNMEERGFFPMYLEGPLNPVTHCRGASEGQISESGMQVNVLLSDQLYGAGMVATGYAWAWR